VQPQAWDGQRMQTPLNTQASHQPRFSCSQSRSRVRTTYKMLLKHKLREGAREMNIVPGLYSTLVSIPKIVDEDYIVVFDKSWLKLTTLKQPQ
jgi:hypothetical protein